MNKEYISIREFAVRANISRQRAYKLVNKRLQGYCKTIENKKCIDISALEELKKVSSVDKICNPIDKTCNLVNKSHLQQTAVHVEHTRFHPVDKTVDQSCNHVDNAIDKIIDSFNKQLEIKDKQIEIKDKQINELTEMLKDVQSKQNELMCSLKAAQALHAGTIQEHIESKIVEQSSDSTEQRSGFWSRLFRKRN